MSETFARPGFGTKIRADGYYAQINAILTTLRHTASQRVIADHLNSQGFRTPRGLPFNRARLANYLRGVNT